MSEAIRRHASRASWSCQCGDRTDSLRLAQRKTQEVNLNRNLKEMMYRNLLVKWPTASGGAGQSAQPLPHS